MADLSRRMLYRKLFKTVRIREDDDANELLQRAVEVVQECGFDPDYYLHQASTEDVHAGDSKQSMLVLMDNGKILPLNESEPLFNAMVSQGQAFSRRWLVMPEEAKQKMGRLR